MTRANPYRAYAENRKAAHQFRQLKTSRPLPEGRVFREDASLTNFAGNDYLGLSRHPLLIARARECTEKYGAGATASRLICGNAPIYAQLEERLARGKGYEAALIFNSGYQANLTVLAALADADVVGKPVTVLADRLSHNSLLQGANLGGARLMRFHHNDYAHLENLLRAQKERDAHIIVVSESVFGMDGDLADLAALGALARRFEAMLYIDEAHATGLFGPDGFGLTAAHKGVVDIAMGTFGKALGSFGAYVACDAVIRDYLIQRCGGLIYSTALPPAVLGAIDAALDLLPVLENERRYLQQQAKRMRQALLAQGWDCGASETHIIPVLLGDEQAATTLAAKLLEHGILAPAIRPPTVPRGSSRLRLSLSAAHRVADIDCLIAAMAEQAGLFAAPRALAS
jgi:8-amino-7-oxononanoate synthase